MFLAQSRKKNDCWNIILLVFNELTQNVGNFLHEYSPGIIFFDCSSRPWNVAYFSQYNSFSIFLRYHSTASLALEIILNSCLALALYRHPSYVLFIKIIFLTIPYFIKAKSYLSAIYHINGATLRYKAADFQYSVTNLTCKEVTVTSITMLSTAPKLVSPSPLAAPLKGGTQAGSGEHPKRPSEEDFKPHSCVSAQVAFIQAWINWAWHFLAAPP